MVRVLFVCELNAARSQMAEVFLKHLGGKDFYAESCGIEAGPLNPLVVEAMEEIGFDLRDNTTKTAFDLLPQAEFFDVVITFYPQVTEKRCPIFPRRIRWFNWPFEAPSRVEGDVKEQLRKIRRIRDQIRAQVENFIAEYRQSQFQFYPRSQPSPGK